MRMKEESEKTGLKLNIQEEDGREIGGHGARLSPWIHQEYTFGNRSAGRTPAERRQEYLTSGKEYTEPGKSWWDEGTRAKDRSVSRTRTALSGWGN